MKTLLPLTLTCLAVSFFLTAASASGPQGALQERVATLEEALAAEKKANLETRSVLRQVQRYLEDQERAAKAMQETLKKAEEQGFAQGINFQSRETLLAGWRRALQAAQKGVPRLPAGAKGKRPGDRRGRQ